MEGTNRAVTIVGGIGVFLTTVGTAGLSMIPQWKDEFLLATIIGGGLTAVAFWLSKGKDVTGGTVRQ